MKIAEVLVFLFCFCSVFLQACWIVKIASCCFSAMLHDGHTGHSLKMNPKHDTLVCFFFSDFFSFFLNTFPVEERCVESREKHPE